MQHKCQFTTGNNVGTGGWIWPGRGLFRVQTRRPPRSTPASAAFLPRSRRTGGTSSRGRSTSTGSRGRRRRFPGDANYAARQGDRVVQLNANAKMDAFKPGGDLWVGAANSLKFYQSQEIADAENDGRLENLHMRQQVFTITAVDTAKRTVTLDKPLEYDLPVDSTSDGSPPLG
ncbi:hypothetical protein ACFQ60_00860 [Streptomyces zhihengii]